MITGEISNGRIVNPSLNGKSFDEFANTDPVLEFNILVNDTPVNVVSLEALDYYNDPVTLANGGSISVTWDEGRILDAACRVSIIGNNLKFTPGSVPEGNWIMDNFTGIKLISVTTDTGTYSFEY